MNSRTWIPLGFSGDLDAVLSGEEALPLVPVRVALPVVEVVLLLRRRFESVFARAV